MKIRTLVKDIRFWIILFFLIRLIGITNPPVEGGHSWRQSFTSMVTRNLVEKDGNILYPRTDLAGEKEDIVASEFPIFNYLMLIPSKLVGFADWYGRLINLFFCSLSIFFFYLLVKRYWDESVAFNASIVLLCSIWFGYSRKIMPDTFSAGLLLMAIYAFSRFVDTGKLLYLAFYILLAALGGLSKIPAVILLTPLSLFLIDAALSLQRKVLIAGSTAFIIAIVSLWYFYWEPYLLNTYHNQLYYPFSFRDGVQEFIRLWKGALEKFYFDSFYSFIAFFCFLSGLFFSIKSRQKTVLCVFSITFVAFILFALKTGDIFPTHNYYIIPFVPVMALIAGYGISQLPLKNYAWLLLFAIGVEGIANQQHDFFLKDEQLYKLRLECIADSISVRTDKLAVNGGMNPQQMYFLHRKGWSLYNHELADSTKINFIKDHGCKYLIINNTEDPITLKYPVIYEDADFTVYKP